MSREAVRGAFSVSKAMPCKRSNAMTSGLVTGTHQAAGSVTTVSGAPT